MENNFFNNTTINSKIKRNIESELARYKKIKYVHSTVNKKNPANVSIISNLPEWFKFYQKNSFQFIDPVVITALTRFTPFSWDEKSLFNQETNSLDFLRLARNNHISNGYTFVLHDPFDNLVMLSLFSENKNENNAEEISQEDKNHLHMLLMLAHEQKIHLYKKAYIKSEFDKMTNTPIFSTRENEIVYWSSVGKSYQEIAIITGIKLTTVKYHMANAVKKLGVNNAKHAIRLSVELKLIRPIFSKHSDRLRLSE